MISIESYDVLEKSINQNFHNCQDEGSTLYLRRTDVVIAIALRMAQKKAVVRCNNTGKNIPKKYWNEETITEAKSLLSQHKTPKLGFYLFALLLLGIIASGIYLFTNNKNSSNAYENAFISKTKEEKTQLLNTLDKNDLLLIQKNIYRIQSVDTRKVVLQKSDYKIDVEKINSFKPIDESLIPENSYTSLHEIKKEDFISNSFVIDGAYVMVFQYLDK